MTVGFYFRSGRARKAEELFPLDSLQCTPLLALVVRELQSVRDVSGDALWRGMPRRA